MIGLKFWYDSGVCFAAMDAAGQQRRGDTLLGEKIQDLRCPDRSPSN